jgi:hypothetical protein
MAVNETGWSKNYIDKYSVFVLNKKLFFNSRLEMAIFRIISLMLTIIVAPLLAQSEVVHYISLGRDCQVAIKLNEFNLRKASYPFDWMSSHFMEGVIKAFKTDFEYFLDPAFLEYRTDHIANTCYHFGYLHFFPLIGQSFTEEDSGVHGIIDPNFLMHLDSVKEVLNRRIKRLQDLLSTKSKIVFIRTRSDRDEAKAFMKMLRSKYPKAKVLLIVVHEREDLIGNWHLPNVLNFYVSQRCGFCDWWSTPEWTEILSQTQNWIESHGIRKVKHHVKLHTLN